MAGSRVFLAGNTGTSLIRSIYEPGSQGVLSAWASSCGLVADEHAGLTSTFGTVSSRVISDASSSSATVCNVLGRVTLPECIWQETPQLVMASAKRRVQSSAFKSKVWSTPLPNGAFLSLAEDLCLSSPAFLFVQQAADLDLYQAIRFGNELCGFYSVDASERGHNNHPPFCSPAELSAFLDACKRGRGTKTARVAIKWVAARFRSPKESDTYLLTCLPREYGGYEIYPKPEVNARIEIPRDLWFLTDVHTYEVDMLWREKRVVIEYDGKDHDNPQQRLRDDTKTHVLEEMGYLVIRVRWEVLSDPREFDRRMRLLGRRLGIEVPPSTTDFMRRRAELRKSIFGIDAR